MKLWILERVDNTSYDEALGFVVRAETEDEAREVVIDPKNGRQYGDEGKEAWLNPNATRCLELTVEGEPQVILRDFHAG